MGLHVSSFPRALAKTYQMRFCGRFPSPLRIPAARKSNQWVNSKTAYKNGKKAFKLHRFAYN